MALPLSCLENWKWVIPLHEVMFRGSREPLSNSRVDIKGEGFGGTRAARSESHADMLTGRLRERLVSRVPAIEAEQLRLSTDRLGRLTGSQTLVPVAAPTRAVLGVRRNIASGTRPLAERRFGRL
ncbi:hypothetical protein B2J93_6565 [Marssonina coronariae]|uniref:Uncharacterized protein n=1 Tax=Diplocarpon coronariae TaxID=2795749 RepID=A0A218Z1G6_9HELO|nr:hypothetical protein B2J93_6565 [Marssonina coronariae]